MKVYLCFFITYCLICCSQFRLMNAKAIIGENVIPAHEGQFQFIVSLLKVHQPTDLSMHHFCTGTLVSEKDILTAAHCLNGKTYNSVRIAVGSPDIRLARLHYVVGWMSYETWGMKQFIILEYEHNDVAMIKLSEKVPQGIIPAAISTLTNIDFINHQVQIAGWGVQINDENPFIMQTAIVTVLSYEQCEFRSQQVDGPHCEFPERFLITAGRPSIQLTCGDDGGPLLYENTIIGISHGTCLLPELHYHVEKLNLHFGIYYYRNFIIDFINNIT